MELNPEDVHTADVTEVQERIDSIMKNDYLMRPEEGIERSLAGIITLAIITRKYLGREDIADRLRMVHTMLSNAYEMGYRRVILGRDPATANKRTVQSHDYTLKWKDYREYSPKHRLEVVWDDVALLIRRTTMMFESILSQKYRTYGADNALYSILGILYGAIDILGNMDDEIQEIIKEADDTPVNPDTDKLKLEELTDETKPLSPSAEAGVKAIAFGQTQLPSVGDVISAEPCNFGDIVLKSGESPVKTRFILDGLIKNGRVESVADSDGVTYYSLKKE